MKRLLLFLICMIYVISTDCGTVKTKIPHTVKTQIPRTGYETKIPQTSENNSSARYRVQIGIFDNLAEADIVAESARAKTNYRIYVEYKIPFYRVQVGDFTRKSDAEQCVRDLKKKGFSDARYVFREGSDR